MSIHRRHSFPRNNGIINAVVREIICDCCKFLFQKSMSPCLWRLLSFFSKTFINQHLQQLLMQFFINDTFIKK